MLKPDPDSLPPYEIFNGGRFISRGRGRHPDRILESDELIVVLQGELAMHEDGVPRIAGPGSWLLLRHGHRHGGLAPYPKNLSFFWLHFRFHESLPEGIPLLGTVSPHSSLTEYARLFLNEQNRIHPDGQILDLDGIKVECILAPGHTWGHMVFLIDDEYLFTGDSIWFGADGGYSFLSTLAEDNSLALRSLEKLEKNIRSRKQPVKIITGHTGWTDDPEFAFRHRDKVCNSFKKQKPHDPNAPYDGYDESDDTEEKARTVRLAKQIDLCGRRDQGFRR